MSVVSTIGYTAFLAGPPLLGFLGDHVGVLHSLLVVGAMAVVALVAIPAVREPEPPRPPGATTPTATTLSAHTPGDPLSCSSGAIVPPHRSEERSSTVRIAHSSPGQRSSGPPGVTRGRGVGCSEVLGDEGLTGEDGVEGRIALGGAARGEPGLAQARHGPAAPQRRQPARLDPQRVRVIASAAGAGITSNRRVVGACRGRAAPTGVHRPVLAGASASSTTRSASTESVRTEASPGEGRPQVDDPGHPRDLLDLHRRQPAQRERHRVARVEVGVHRRRGGRARSDDTPQRRRCLGGRRDEILDRDGLLGQVVDDEAAVDDVGDELVALEHPGERRHRRAPSVR